MSTLLPPTSKSAPSPQAAPGALRPLAKGEVEIINPHQQFSARQAADRRAEPREACNDRGLLIVWPQNETVNCHILDQSPSGARIMFESLSQLSAEMWLIDLDNNNIRRGTVAWSMPHRMGLKFNLALVLKPGEPRPEKVPAPIFEHWLKLTAKPGPDEPEMDVFFLDL